MLWERRIQQNLSFEKFVEKPAKNTRQKKKTAWSLKGSVVNPVFLNCVAVRASIPIYYKWSKEFLAAGKQHLAGDTKRQATSSEVSGLKQGNQQLKELVADLSLKNVVKLQNYYLPGELEQKIETFVEYYNHQRVHEALDNMTLADVYFNRSKEIKVLRNLVKKQTLERRRREKQGLTPLKQKQSNPQCFGHVSLDFFRKWS